MARQLNDIMYNVQYLLMQKQWIKLINRNSVQQEGLCVLCTRLVINKMNKKFRNNWIGQSPDQLLSRSHVPKYMIK